MTTALVAGVRSVELAVTDLTVATRFYTSVWSLRVVASRPDGVYLAGQGPYPYILSLHHEAQPTIRRFTFDVATTDALRTLHGQVGASGLPVSSRIRSLESPGGGDGFDSRDPEGRNISFACGGHVATPALPLPDRITKVTHLNLNSGDYPTTRRYLAETLGCRVIDETRLNGFFNCGSDHHAIVVGKRDNACLNHIAFEMPDLDSTMRMAGTMTEAGYPIEWGVGRHGPGNNVFAYFAGPDELPIECTAEVLQVDETYRYRGPDEWNFPPGRVDQWGVTGAPSARIKRIQNQFRFPDLALR